MQTRQTEFNITVQGKVIVEGVILVDRTAKTARLIVDLRSKYAQSGGEMSDDNGCPVIFLCADEHTLKIDKRYKSDLTGIAFTEFPDWFVWSVTVSKHTAHVTLYKGE